MLPENLETDRLLLKTLTREAAPMVLSFYEDNKLLFEPWDTKRSINFYTLPYHKAFLSAETNHIAEGRLVRYWAFLKDQPEEIVGTVCFHNFLCEPYQSCSLGYKFSHKYLHQGYAYESIKRCVELMFVDYRVHRMEAFIMPDNKPSLHLIERLSFHYEGLSSSYARINGVWTDHKRYALIHPEDLPGEL